MTKKEIKNIADKIETIVINWGGEKIETKEELWDRIAIVLKDLKMVEKTIKLEAEIDLTNEKAEVRVKPVDGIWQDFGYWLEVTGFMAYQAMKYKEKEPEEIAEYAKNYILKCLKDYKMKRLKQ